jgi:hypothetical protein
MYKVFTMISNAQRQRMWRERQKATIETAKALLTSQQRRELVLSVARKTLTGSREYQANIRTARIAAIRTLHEFRKAIAAQDRLNPHIGDTHTRNMIIAELERMAGMNR